MLTILFALKKKKKKKEDKRGVDTTSVVFFFRFHFCIGSSGRYRWTIRVMEDVGVLLFFRDCNTCVVDDKKEGKKERMNRKEKITRKGSIDLPTLVHTSAYH
jgi:hypothetical protein